ncbi:hypothetical protein FIU93_17795 [Labrenzia sp. THAF35]|nr:hypothetical protein FIU93_17795 [Labrenzia sp. THAF35]
MIRWIAKLKNLPLLRKVFQRDQEPELPISEFLRQNVLTAAKPFPNDKVHQEIMVENELFMRKVLGKQKHDA